jgi:membrane-bound lytic murein transglycosylase MltF
MNYLKRSKHMNNLIKTGLLCLAMTACGDQSANENELASALNTESANTDFSNAEIKTETPDESTSAVQSMSDQNSVIGEGPIALTTWVTGDLDLMEERRVIRVLTVYGLGRYWLDGAVEKGLTYELFKMYEAFINDHLGKKELKVHVIFIPVARDELIPGLINGRGDIAAAGLTITAKRDEIIDFSDPASKDVSEILVSGPSAPAINSIDDLSAKKILVRASSSYRDSLEKLNRRFKQEGKAEIDIQDVAEILEDDDLLEMVNAGLLDWVVVDNYKARVWANVFENLKVHDDIIFREGGRIGFAIREDSPLLKQSLNEFLKTHKQGTLKGNILINRNIKKFDWAQNALDASEYERFEDLVAIFETYGDQYGIDFLMVAAQGYQESRLNQNARSGAGAIGIMQLLQSTASDSNVGIDDISKAEDNIHAGVKYLNFIRERYFSDPDMDQFNKTMFAFAAYNAGPARVRGLRARAEKAGYNPNVWFDNVEVIAAKEIGRETVQYVSNILKYYIAYRLSLQQQIKRGEARKEHGVG